MTELPPEGWPNRAASRIVACPPHRWHLQETGTGPDALLLHGAGASGHSWAKLVERFQSRYRMFVPDLPGHGYTRSPRGRARLPDVARDLAALSESVGAKPSLLIGHSAGGAIALEMVRQGLVKPDGVVIVNGALEDFKGAAGWLFPIMARVLSVSPFTGLLLTSGRNVDGQVRNMIRATGADLDDAALARYATLMRRRSHIEGTLAMMAQWSLAELNRALPVIAVPVLFLHGENDSAVPIRVAERAAGLMPNARLVRLPDVGHLAHEEAPDRVAEEIAEFAEVLTKRS